MEGGEYNTVRLAKANYKKALFLAEADMTLKEAQIGEEYIIKEILTDDEELDSFLFTLGCYAGQPITVISHLKGGCVVSIKEGRYNIDYQLAEAIKI